MTSPESMLKQRWWFKEKQKKAGGGVCPEKGISVKGESQSVSSISRGDDAQTTGSENSHLPSRHVVSEHGWLTGLTLSVETSPSKHSSAFSLTPHPHIHHIHRSSRKFSSSWQEHISPHCRNYHSMLSGFHFEHKLIKWHFSSSVSDDFE